MPARTLRGRSALGLQGSRMNQSDTLTVAELIELLATLPQQSAVWVDVGEPAPNLMPMDIRRRDSNDGVVILGG
jgi:hypothetical protein